MTINDYFHYEGSDKVRDAATIVFAVSIALLGWVMMTLTSSPIAKGAAFLWLPAALQLLAGVWLGPVRALIAGGLGAYAAGILAYGGWGIPDIVMNPVAGGLINSALPALLFAWFSIDPNFSTDRQDVKKALLTILSLVVVVIAMAFWLKGFELGPFAYAPPFMILILAPLVFTSLRLSGGDFALGLLISIAISFISAGLGVYGTMLAGQSFEAAVVGTGIGWFLGDTVSCVLGLYALGAFTKRAQELGIAPIPKMKG